MRPVPISDELSVFVSVPLGTLISRADVTKKVIKYIKDNDLQKPDDRRKVIPDQTLMDLFQLTNDDEVTYFNMQTFLKLHFLKEPRWRRCTKAELPDPEYLAADIWGEILNYSGLIVE